MKHFLVLCNSFATRDSCIGLTFIHIFVSNFNLNTEVTDYEKAFYLTIPLVIHTDSIKSHICTAYTVHL